MTIKQTDFIHNLSNEDSEIIKEKITIFFTEEGMLGDSLAEEVEIAMDGRISDLDGILDMDELMAELTLGRWDTDEEETAELIEELDENPDFSTFGPFGSFTELVDEMAYQGLSREKVEELSKARYGSVIEIVKDSGVGIWAFVGTR